MKEEDNLETVDSCYDTLKESEPYLGPAWAFAMLIIYGIMQLFPLERFSFFWWVEIYVIVLVLCITVFTLVKRRNYYKNKVAGKNKSSKP